MTVEGLGPGFGVTAEDMPLPRRTNTLGALDFAYWAALNAAPYPTYGMVTVDDESPLNGTELVIWALSQVGIVIPFNMTYDKMREWCAGYEVSVEEALTTRGALIFSDTAVAITLGFHWFIEAKGDHHFVRKQRGLELARWTTGSMIPGVIY